MGLNAGPGAYTGAAMNRATHEPILSRSDAGGIATLTLNRPEARNSLNMALMEALSQALADLRADESVKAVILAAAGSAFCAGHDLKEMRANPGRAAYERVFAACSALMTAIVAAPGSRIAVDLAAQTVTAPDGTRYAFDIDPFPKHCLLNGLDELDYTLSQMDQIVKFERRYEAETPAMPCSNGTGSMTR